MTDDQLHVGMFVRYMDDPHELFSIIRKSQTQYGIVYTIKSLNPHYQRLYLTRIDKLQK